MAQTKLGEGVSNTKGPGVLHPIDLPSVRLGSRRTLASALRLRQTVREFSDRGVTRRTLSNLLWAACGVNRRRGPFGLSGRTAASASNSQEVDLYVVLQAGAYCYDALRHRLLPVAAGDLRPFAIGRRQSTAGHHAPVRLIYVADLDKLIHSRGYQEPGLHDSEIQRSYYCVDTGLIAGNVYLYAASAGLAAWFHNCDRAALASRLGLRAAQRVLFGQTVGYPKRRG